MSKIPIYKFERDMLGGEDIHVRRKREYTSYSKHWHNYFEIISYRNCQGFCDLNGERYDLTDIRMDCAKRMLALGDLPIIDVDLNAAIPRPHNSSVPFSKASVQRPLNTAQSSGKSMISNPFKSCDLRGRI